MWCHVVIPGKSDFRFRLHTGPSSSTGISITDPCMRLFNISLPNRKPVSIRIQCRATINGDFVTTEATPTRMTFYDLLDIPESGTLLQIKQAYKQLARKYHPDVSPPDRVEEYTQRFIRVQEAYETLSDPRRRAVYDRNMARGLHLAFSARKRCYADEGMEESMDEWKERWQGQLSELKRRSMQKDSAGSMSWGARMRRQMNEPSVTH
ncbi:chaperone protein dnaJ 20, chloroplastic-like [Malania oleifera]|uniref:chaperone protein dnaJ 20, chloroplastic-like n=1 Tax=Malania oleifera TaxID=397392 RepID=UPI0025AE5F9E|nr:chaperone protein dnaJ 20, chloroplastic-like [Malania oleifera]